MEAPSANRKLQALSLTPSSSIHFFLSWPEIRRVQWVGCVGWYYRWSACRNILPMCRRRWRCRRCFINGVIKTEHFFRLPDGVRCRAVERPKVTTRKLVDLCDLRLDCGNTAHKHYRYNCYYRLVSLMKWCWWLGAFSSSRVLVFISFLFDNFYDCSCRTRAVLLLLLLLLLLVLLLLLH